MEPPLDETCGKGGSDGCDVSPTFLRARVDDALASDEDGAAGVAALCRGAGGLCGARRSGFGGRGLLSSCGVFFAGDTVAVRVEVVHVDVGHDNLRLDLVAGDVFGVVGYAGAQVVRVALSCCCGHGDACRGHANDEQGDDCKEGSDSH